MPTVPTTDAVVTATPVEAVAETKKEKKARLAAEKKAAEAAAVADGSAPAAPVKKITDKTYGKGLPNSGINRTYDLPWGAKKIAVLSTLKALGATGPTSAKSAKEVIAAAAENGITLTGRDVRHYTYHASAGGLAGVTDKLPEGAVGGGYGFFLTGLGMEQDYPALSASLVKVPVAAVPAPEAAPAS